MEPQTPRAATATSNGTGAFAVQLAAAGSEAEARERMTTFTQKFASQLGGRHLGYKAGESNGKTVWRVRVGGLSQESATELCNQVKAGGGACFVAHN